MVPTRVDLDQNRRTIGFCNGKCAKKCLLRLLQPILQLSLSRLIVWVNVKGGRVNEHDILLCRNPQSSLCFVCEFASDCLYVVGARVKVRAYFDETAPGHLFYELRGH